MDQQRTGRGLRRWHLVLGVIVIGGLLLRTVGLGGRVFHWDEARVGYWTLRYMETGSFACRPVIHGPFLPLVNAWIFDLVGVSDGNARLVVALGGAAIPAMAIGLRRWIAPGAVVGVAVLIATDPTLVYYSRFMRNDVLVAGATLAAVVLVAIAVDADRPVMLIPAGALLGAAVTMKATVLLYGLSALGAAILVLDDRLLRGAGDRRASALIADRWARTRRWIEANTLRYAVATVIALVLLVALAAWGYAPRPEVHSGPLTNRTIVAVGGLSDAVGQFVDFWLLGDRQEHGYLPYLAHLLRTLVIGSPVLVSLGIAGIIAERYGRQRRPIVAFAGWWTLLAVIGYPLATDIKAPWNAVHVLLPLSVPAGVTLAALVRTAAAERRQVAVAASVGLVVLTGVTGAGLLLYHNSADVGGAPVVQWAQPGGELRDALEAIDTATAGQTGVDLLYVGGPDGAYHLSDPTAADAPPPGGPGWHDRLPLPWYTERMDLIVMSVPEDADLRAELHDPPPVVITPDARADEVRALLPMYTERTVALRLWDREVVVLTAPDRPQQ